MRFSYWTGNGHPWSEIRTACMHADSTGWDGIFIADHFMPFQGDRTGPIHEGWAMLAAIAAVTSQARLGTLVSGNTYRNPAHLAKTAATVDDISNGRCLIGLGAGWQENEHRAFGFDYGTVGDRSRWLEEACEVIKALNDSPGGANFSGTRYSLVDAPLSPAPVQPRLPLLIGGGGERRTLRTAARYADEWNVWGTPELIRDKLAILHAHCDDVGRDPSEIGVSAVALVMLVESDAHANKLRERDFGRPTVIGMANEMVDALKRYREVGVDEFVVPDFTMGAVAQRVETIDRFQATVAAHLR